MAWQEDVLGALAAGARTWPEAARQAGVNVETLRSELKRNRDFGERARALKGRSRLLLGEAKVAETGAVPDFLTWREQHCAYFNPRYGNYQRAQNTWFQRDAYRQLQEHSRCIMVLPPGHIKTTFFGIEHSAWAIQSNRNIRITNIQKNQEEAAKVVAAVQQRLTDHDYYTHLAAELLRQGDEPIRDPVRLYGGREGYRPKSYGSGGRWGAYQFRVRGTVTGEKDPTMQAKGVGSQVQGNRADLIILDDIQDPMKAGPGDSQKLLDWVQRVILGRITDFQKLIILTNRISPDDFGSYLMRAVPHWPVIEYPARLPDGSLLCPEIWTREALESKELEVGPEVYHYQWMQGKGTFGMATFTREQMLACLDYDRDYGERPARVSDIIIAVDPAIARQGYCAITVLGVSRSSGMRYLIEQVNAPDMQTYGHIVTKVEALVRQYGAKTVVVETASQQATVLRDVQQAVAKYGGIRVVPYHPATNMGAQARETDFSISNIAGLMNDRLFSIPYNSAETRKLSDLYIEQFCGWRPKPPGRTSWSLTRDMVMSTLFAESEARRFVEAGPIPETPIPRKGVPPWAMNKKKRWRWER